MRATRFVAFLTLLTFGLVACKSEVEVKAQAEKRALALAAEAKAAMPAPAAPAVAPAHLKDSLERIQHSMKGRIVPGPVLVSVQRLQAMLPSEVAGMKRVELTGKQIVPAGLKVSKASAQFDAGPASIRITVSDLGQGVALRATQAWMKNEIAEESSAGYTRTGQFEGQRAYERYVISGGRAELKFLVAGRFLVEAFGFGIEMDALKKATSGVKMGELRALKRSGERKTGLKRQSP